MWILLKRSIIYKFIMLFIYCLSTRTKKDRGFVFFFFQSCSLMTYGRCSRLQGSLKEHLPVHSLSISCVNFMFCISDCAKVKVTKHQSVQRRSELLLLLPPLLPTNFECLLHASYYTQLLPLLISEPSYDIDRVISSPYRQGNRSIQRINNLPAVNMLMFSVAKIQPKKSGFKSLPWSWSATFP